MVTVGRTMMNLALVTGGSQTRTKHSIKPSKWDFSWASLAVVTLMGWELQRTGTGDHLVVEPSVRDPLLGLLVRLGVLG